MDSQDYYGYVYLITDLKHNKIYIGQKKGKVEDSENYFGSGTIIRRIIKKRGISLLKKEILELCSSKEELTERETYYKYKYNALDPSIGYNIIKIDMIPGGNVPAWNKGFTKETHPTLKRMSDRSKGRPSPHKGKPSEKKGKTLEEIRGSKEKAEETKKKESLSRLGEKNNMYKKSLYDVWIEKYGKEKADERMIEYKKLQSDINSNENNGFFGKEHTKETKEKISKSHIGKYDGDKNPMYGKSVYSVWVEKYGVEEADRRKEEMNKKQGKKKDKVL